MDFHNIPCQVNSALPERGLGLRTWAVPSTLASCWSRWSCWNAPFHKMVCCTMLAKLYNMYNISNCQNLSYSNNSSSSMRVHNKPFAVLAGCFVGQLGQLGCNSCPDHQRQPSRTVWDHVALFCGCHDPLAWLFSCLRQLKRMKPIKTLNQMQWLSHLGKPTTLNRAGLKPSHPFSTERKTWRVVSKFQNALISSATKSYQYFHVGSHFSEWEHHSQNVRNYPIGSLPELESIWLVSKLYG